MTKVLEQAIDAARALPDKEQNLVAKVIFSVVERSKDLHKIDIERLARRVSREAKQRGMTQEIFDKIMADA